LDGADLIEELTAEEVRSALQGWLEPEALVEVSRDQPNGRITGWIMHPGFTGISHATRQAWLWDGFEQTGLLKRSNSPRRVGFWRLDGRRLFNVICS